MATDLEPGGKKPVSGRRKLAELVGLIAVSTLVMFVLSSIALLIYTNDSGDPVQYSQVRRPSLELARIRSRSHRPGRSTPRTPFGSKTVTT